MGGDMPAGQCACGAPLGHCPGCGDTRRPEGDPAEASDGVVTPEMVQAISPVRLDTATRIATYATLRGRGVRLVDAAQAVPVTRETARSYERIVAQLVDVPPTPQRTDWQTRVWQNAHRDSHVPQQLVKTGCPYCRESRQG